jgi:hypothetical protein
VKHVLMLVVTSVLLSSVAGAEGEMPNPAQKEHEWLQQLAGEWETESEVAAEPGKPPMKMKGSESIRLLGKIWAINDVKSEMVAGGTLGMLTLGYDAEKKKYVGTWVDGMVNHLWRYEGTLDAAGKVLTLETEGPSHEAGKLGKFRETIEIKSKDHKVFQSSILKDGKWVVFLTTHSKRKK